MARGPLQSFFTYYLYIEFVYHFFEVNLLLCVVASVVLLSIYVSETYVERERGESANDRNDRAIREASSWYSSHLEGGGSLKVILLTNDKANLNKAQRLAKGSILQVYTGTTRMSVIHTSYEN